MNLHLISGFLGSGKTTAIIHAAKALINRGKQVGVVTNDQGKYLVDTAFFRLADLPAVEVTGGCFCCNYDDLNARLAQLIATTRPDVVFAESVGSCADLVATVVKPLLELGRGHAEPSSFSVFTDARLLRRRLLGQEMPFSDDVVYIFDKQIEEAGLIVVNKVDLLSSLAVEEIRVLLKERFPGKPILMQSSLNLAGVMPWLDLIQSGHLGLSPVALDIDYARYGAGEAHLAWLDEQINLRFPAGEGRQRIHEVIAWLVNELNLRRAGIGHLKFILQGAGVDARGSGAKLSFTTLEAPGWEEDIPDIVGEEVSLLVNARVEMEAGELKALLDEALRRSGVEYFVQAGDAFHPPQPRPAHRMV
jgi:Ni2+-binding GTPase involved in maturation of urease and hydrogenase